MDLSECSWAPLSLSHMTFCLLTLGPMLSAVARHCSRSSSCWCYVTSYGRKCLDACDWNMRSTDHTGAVRGLPWRPERGRVAGKLKLADRRHRIVDVCCGEFMSPRCGLHGAHSVSENAHRWIDTTSRTQVRSSIASRDV